MHSALGLIVKDLYDNPNVPVKLDMGRHRACTHRVNIFIKPQVMLSNGSLPDFNILSFVIDVQRALADWVLAECPDDYQYIEDGEVSQIRFEHGNEFLYVNPYIFKGCLLPKHDKMKTLKATLDKMHDYKYQYHQTVERIYDISERQLKNLLKRNRDIIKAQVIENFATPCASSEGAIKKLLHEKNFALYPIETMYNHMPSFTGLCLDHVFVTDSLYDAVEEAFDEALEKGEIIEVEGEEETLYRAATDEEKLTCG